MLNLKCWIKFALKPIVLACLVMIFTNVRSQTIFVDSTRFPIGSKLNLTLRIPFNDSEKVVWPVIKDTITKSIEILSRSNIDTIKLEDNTGTVLQQIISITSFDTGFIPLPPFTFKITGTGGQNAELSTEPLLLEVYKVTVDPKADIKDIKPVMKAPITFAELIPWLAALLITGIIAYGILYYLKNRKKPAVEKPQPKIKIPSWEIALRKLEELKAEQKWQRGEIKEYYTQLTDILREYFEMRFNVNAVEMTSSEIIDSMRPYISEENGMPSLRNLLYLADMAKFAKAQPGAYENEQSIIYGFEIINLTKSQLFETETRVSKTE